jgi:hypothetical protein
MAKYLLRRGMTRLPIDGVCETLREGLPSLKHCVAVVFEPGRVVDSDLDFGPWVADGTLVRVREAAEPPRPPKPAPVTEPKPQILTPMPAFVQAEVVEAPAAEAPAAEAEEAPQSPDADARRSARRGRR